jgi:hypothetical protein
VGGAGGPVVEGPDDVDLGDMWLLDLLTFNWTRVYPSGTIPPPSDGAGMQLVPEQNSAYRFGGCTCYLKNDFNKTVPASACFVNTLYRLNLDQMQWSLISPVGSSQRKLVPSKRSFPTMTYQQVYLNLLIFLIAP